MCALSGTRLPGPVCDELREQDQLTQSGIDAAPTKLRMKLKESATYTYSIGARDQDAVVRGNVANGSVPVTSGTAALGHFNYAQLTGDGGIKIEPLDDEVQDTKANPTPIWRWRLTATEPGAHQLKLVAGVELRASGVSTRLGQPAKRIDVDVNVGGVDKIAQFADTTNSVLGISTDLLKKLAIFFGAVGAAFAAFRAIRGKAKADSNS
jgi:hypothetical protein